MPKKAKEDPYYAVARGSRVGIFRSWDEAQKCLVHGVGQKHKKFKTLGEAEEFIAENRKDRDRYDGFNISPPGLQTSVCTEKPSSTSDLELSQFNYEQSMSSLSPMSPMSPDLEQSVLNSEPREFRPEFAASNLVASPSCDVVFDSESEPESNPELVRFVELVSLPDADVQEEWGWDTGHSSRDVRSKKSGDGESAVKSPNGPGQRCPTAESLLKDYKLNYEKAEGLALSYISEDLHHPAISCFREITKADVNLLFVQGKLKKSFNNLELAVLCLGMIDYFAISVNNPLYENNKTWSKTISGSVEKVMQEFKGIIRSWGMSDQDYMQKRVDIVLSYLHKLVPRFRPVGYGRSLEAIIQNLETDIMRKQHENSGDISPKFELKISQSIFEDTTEVEVDEDTVVGGRNPPQDSRAICDKIPHTLKKETDGASRNKKLHTSTKSKGSKLPSAKRVISSVNTDDVVVIGSVNPAKKARLNPLVVVPVKSVVAPTPTNASDSDKEKVPIRNAFAVLMDRSREISAQKRLLKLAKEQTMGMT